MGGWVDVRGDLTLYSILLGKISCPVISTDTASPGTRLRTCSRHSLAGGGSTTVFFARKNPTEYSTFSTDNFYSNDLKFVTLR